MVTAIVVVEADAGMYSHLCREMAESRACREKCKGSVISEKEWGGPIPEGIPTHLVPLRGFGVPSWRYTFLVVE